MPNRVVTRCPAAQYTQPDPAELPRERDAQPGTGYARQSPRAWLPQARLRRARHSLLIIIASMLAAGCVPADFFSRAEIQEPLELDYNRVLPAGWQPITRWYEVNIDGDGDTEYLLLFTYDAGQVGAVIYDQQVSTDLMAPLSSGADDVDDAEGGDGAERGDGTVTGSAGATAPLQAFGYYRPYLLLPSNWDYTYGGAVSHGFVAHPGDANNIAVSQVRRSAGNNLAGALGLNDAERESAGPGAIHPSSELVVQGGVTHLTFVWWKNRHEGYGVTQLYAPGGFRGIDWASWRDAPQPIDEISGLFPLADYRARSLLCRETAFTRVGAARDPGAVFDRGGSFLSGDESLLETEVGPGARGVTGGGPAVEPGPESDNGDAPSRPPTLPQTGSGAGLPNIAFAARDEGIQFCTPAVPVQPFYPEGVALAYLLAAREGAGDRAVTLLGNNANSNTRAEHLVTPGVGGFILNALDLEALAQERVNDVETFATVPVAPAALQNGTFSPATGVCVELAQRQNPTQRRWLLFTLRFHAPDMQARTPERWTISGVAAQPPPINGAPAGYCRQILGPE